MINIHIYGGKNCLQCQRAIDIIRDWSDSRPDFVRFLYTDLSKSSPTYFIDLELLGVKLGYIPEYIPIIFINDNEVKLSELNNALRGSFINS